MMQNEQENFLVPHSEYSSEAFVRARANRVSLRMRTIVSVMHAAQISAKSIVNPFLTPISSLAKKGYWQRYGGVQTPLPDTQIADPVNTGRENMIRRLRERY